MMLVPFDQKACVGPDENGNKNMFEGTRKSSGDQVPSMLRFNELVKHDITEIMLSVAISSCKPREATTQV